MSFSALTAISPIDGRYHQKTEKWNLFLSEFALLKFRVLIEIRWLEALAANPKITEVPALSPGAKKVLKAIFENFSEADAMRIKEIETITNHDVKAIEYFLKECVAGHEELAKISEFIHFACTSEDINNLAYGLMLQTTREQCLLPELTSVIAQLKSFAHQYASQAMLAHTHGQPATPTTVGKEFANVAARIERQLQQILAVPILGKMNGASGNFNAHVVTYPEIDWREFNKKFVTDLGLIWNPYTTQIEPHDYLAEICAAIQRANTILIDFNRDVWGYIALNYLQQKPVAGEIGSSTMPHKINPIDFENAEGNLGIANALLQHFAEKLPISRWQRDLSDSTVLRNLGVAIAHSLLAYQTTLQGLKKIDVNRAVIEADLNQHWEILAEPIQTVMRRFGIPEPYEKLKAITRGHVVNQKIFHDFIAKLNLPPEVKKKLFALTPLNYLGYAAELAQEI